jgi:PAS domain-containing protein
MRSAGTALIDIAPTGWGLIVRVNHELAELLASTPEALVGTRLHDHVHPADHAAVADVFVGLVGDPRRSYEGSGRLLDADRIVRSVDVHASLIAAGDKQALLVRVAARAP